MLDAAQLVDGLLGRSEEILAIAQGHRTGDYCQLQIEQVGHRRNGSTDPDPDLTPHIEIGLGRRATSRTSDAGARCHTFEKAAHVVCIGMAARFHKHMANVACIALCSVEQSTVEDDATTNTG